MWRKNHRRAVGGDFDDVVGGVGVGFGEVGDDDFVDAGLGWAGGDTCPYAVRVLGSINSPKMARPGSRSCFKSQHGQRDWLGFGAGQAHYADAAASGRSGDGDDGVVKIHDRL